MSSKKKSFLEDLTDYFALQHAVEVSKGPDGKPDPYKAAGIAWGLKGNLSLSNIADLGSLLGAQGAFDTTTYSTSAMVEIPDDELPDKEPEEIWEDGKADNEADTLQWKSRLTIDQMGEALRHGINIDDFNSEADFFAALEYGRLRFMRYDKSVSDLTPEEIIILQARAMRIEPDSFKTFAALRAEVEDHLRWYDLDMQRLFQAYELGGWDYNAYQDLVKGYTISLRMPPPEEFNNAHEYIDAMNRETELIRKLKDIADSDPNAERRRAANELAEIKYEYGHAFASEEDRKAAIQRLMDILFPPKRLSPRKRAMERRRSH